MKENIKNLLLTAKSALADLEGIMPEFEPSGEREHSAWKTIKELKSAIVGIEVPRSPVNDEDRARVMTSLHPPTNQILLLKWLELSKDSDLKELILSWIQYIDGNDNSLSYSIPHEKVTNKLISNFYD